MNLPEAFVSKRLCPLLGAAVFLCILTGCATSIQQTVASPVISPAGGTFTVSQQVTLTDNTPGAVIHYTTDGTAPTASSPTYSAAFTLTSSQTVRAYATSAGYADSREAAVRFNLAAVLPAAAPGISPFGGFFATPQTATLSDSTPGAVIHFTIDGSTPTATSPIYNGPIAVNTTTNLQAIATAAGYTVSSISQAVFNIIVPAAGTLSGTVQTGGGLLTGATVQLYVAGNGGFGSTAAPMSAATAITGVNGQFSLPTRCETAADLVYAVVRGGTASAHTTASTDSLVLVSALGFCGTLPPNIVVNDMTTVAAAWALGQFAPAVPSSSAATQIGTTSTNSAGLQNAFLTATSMADPVTGKAGGPNLPATSTLPARELNTLANIAGSCTAGTGNNPCGALLAAATLSGGAVPADSFTAMVNLARNPTMNPAGLYGLAAGGAFSPQLAGAPVDWTVALQHTGGGLATPTQLAVDAAGNIWVADYAGALSKFSPQGRPLSPVAGFTGGTMRELYGLAVDPTGNVWLTNQESNGINGGQGIITKFAADGTLLSGTGFGAGAVDFPLAIAATASGNMWVANFGNSTAAQLSPAGAALTPNGGLGSGKFAFPVAVAVDADGSATFANQSDSTITEVTAAYVVGNPISCCNGASGVAIDAHGNRWITNFSGNSISEVSAAGAVLSPGFSGGGLTQPQGIAIDGAGGVWITNYHGTALTRLQGADDAAPGTAVSGSNGLGSAAALSLPYGIAMDAAGNVWTANSGSSVLTEFVGAAKPVKTPLTGRPSLP